MYNSFNYNTTNYNDKTKPAAPIDLGDIVFNDYPLQTTEIVTTVRLHDSTPERDVSFFDIPKNDGQGIISDFWRKKTVSIEGYIRMSTNALLEAEIDSMKKALSKREGVLDIKINGVVRRYHATLMNGHNLFSDRKKFHITLCPFKAEFLTVEPFGYAINYQTSDFLDLSALVFNENIVNYGTARAKPVIILNFSAAVGVTKINFKNNTRGEEIELTKAINAGDYVVFDSENLEVTVNGDVQDYSGSFPLLDTDNNSISLTVTGTSSVYSLTTKYKIPYL